MKARNAIEEGSLLAWLTLPWYVTSYRTTRRQLPEVSAARSHTLHHGEDHSLYSPRERLTLPRVSAVLLHTQPMFTESRGSPYIGKFSLSHEITVDDHCPGNSRDDSPRENKPSRIDECLIAVDALSPSPVTSALMCAVGK
jgi:hypothetical protein